MSTEAAITEEATQFVLNLVDKIFKQVKECNNRYLPRKSIKKSVASASQNRSHVESEVRQLNDLNRSETLPIVNLGVKVKQ